MAAPQLAATERYRRGVEQSRTRRDNAPYSEVRDLWDTIAQSYVFLLERELRLQAEEAERNNGGLSRQM